MKTINISQNISELRKTKGITQEQLAAELSISPQAVSKWETGTSLPDLQTAPLIADYFGVSIDYLFYGQDIVGDEIYEKVFEKVSSRTQQSKEAYEDALAVFRAAHYGIIRGGMSGGMRGDDEPYPYHISDECGLSLSDSKGYGAIITRTFFENVGKDTADFAASMLPAIAEKNCLLVCMAIISMSDISIGELEEKLGLDENTLRQALDKLIAAKIVVEKESKHTSLGFTYEINSMYHTCLCILIATLEMQRQSLGGISCVMGYGDYPIRL